MKKTNLILLFVLGFFCFTCKKTHTCQCTNPGGTFKAFSTTESEKKAQKKCIDYYNKNYGNVIMSETFCEVK